MQLGGIGQEPRHRGFAGARRYPEDQRTQRARRKNARQRALRPEDMILADGIRERTRAQFVRKRMRRVLLHPRRGEQACTFAWSLRAHPPRVTWICWPPRTTVMRQSRAASRVAFSRSLVLAIFWLFTARMISPFWHPTPAAVESSPISVTTTPSVSASRCSSSATAGEMLATLAPWNGERVVSTISLRPTSGAASIGTVSLTGIAKPMPCEPPERE